MSLIERMAINIGTRSRTILDVDENREKVIVYGAISLLQLVWAIGWTSIVSLIFGVFYEAIIFLTIISILRKYSGGVHASSPNRCVFIGTFVATVTGLIVDRILYKINIYFVVVAGIVFILIALIIIIRNAPVDSINKPISKPELKQRFKFCSIIIILIYLLIMVASLILYTIHQNLIYIKFFQCIGLGTLWQSITLTENGAKGLNKFDAALKYIFR